MCDGDAVGVYQSSAQEKCQGVLGHKPVKACIILGSRTTHEWVLMNWKARRYFLTIPYIRRRDTFGRRDEALVIDWGFVGKVNVSRGSSLKRHTERHWDSDLASGREND